jgi:hypothetical protein
MTESSTWLRFRGFAMLKKKIETKTFVEIKLYKADLLALLRVSGDLGQDIPDRFINLKVTGDGNEDAYLDDKNPLVLSYVSTDTHEEPARGKQ